MFIPKWSLKIMKWQRAECRIERVDIRDEDQKCQTFLFGLSSYT